MPYAFTHDIDVTPDAYQQLVAGIKGETPKGLVAHIVTTLPEGGLRFNVWETKSDWETFAAEKIGPAARALSAQSADDGAQGRPAPVTEVDVVDIWVP